MTSRVQNSYLQIPASDHRMLFQCIYFNIFQYSETFTAEYWKAFKTIERHTEILYMEALKGACTAQRSLIDETPICWVGA